MAAPIMLMARLLQKGVWWSAVASSVRQSVVNQVSHKPIQHRVYSVCTQHKNSVVDSLAKRLANQCTVGESLFRPFSSLTSLTGSQAITTRICSNPRLSMLQPTITFPVQPKRTIIRYSLGKGKKKSVSAVLDRFYRFNSGLWLRCRAGRNKKLWTKSKKRRHRIKQFVFCSRTQSKKLDLMVTRYWRRQKHIPGDPFAPFENRNWYGYKDYPGTEYVSKMFNKNAPINMPHKKRQY